MTAAVASAAALPAGPSAALARVAALQQYIAQTCSVPSVSQLTGGSFAATLAGATAAPASAGSTATATAGTATANSSLAAPFSSSSPTTTDPAATTASVAAGGAGASTSDATAGEPTTAYDGMIAQAASKYGIDPALLHGVIEQESGYNPNAVSSAGAQGLTQIMPFNDQSLGVTNPFDPAQSIDAGAHLLRENLDTFKGNVVDAVAAYNAGAGAVQQYGGVPPYPQTQSYVTSVLADAQAYGQSVGETSSVAADPTTAGATAAPSTPTNAAVDSSAAAATSPLGGLAAPVSPSAVSLDPAAVQAYALYAAQAPVNDALTTGGSTT